MRSFLVNQGRSVALANAKLGHPTLHVNQEDQVVGMCPGVEANADTTEEDTTAEVTETDPPFAFTAPPEAESAPGGDCKDTLKQNPACTFGGLCDCEEMVNAPQVEGDGCNGVYKNNFGNIAILSVCAKYCGCPGGEIPAVEASGPSFCFSADSTVKVLGKGAIAMKHLNVGDKVLAGDSGAYEAVYGFAHYDPLKTAEFLQIEARGQNANRLELTADHLVYLNGYYQPAKSIKIGDRVQTAAGSATVTKITTESKMGLYAPLTPSGTLLVDGIKVSSYVTLQKDESSQQLPFNFLARHEFIHMVLSPLRMACTGISSSLCSNDYINDESGYPPVVGMGISLAGFIDQKLQVGLQMVVLFLAVCIFYPLHFVELVFGAALAPLIIMVAGLTAVCAGSTWQTKIRSVVKNLKLKIA